MNQELFDRMWNIFKNLGKTALIMSHYDLADKTEIDNSQMWKQFLMEPEVAEWVKTETKLIQDSELNKMIQGISSSNSVGRAQLMNTLAKLNEDKAIKEGPIFIYTYVPLSPEQKQAENINILDKDPFLRR